METKVIQYIALQANIRMASEILNYIPPIYDTIIYPTKSDYVDFYIDQAYLALIELCTKIKHDCINSGYIDSMENNALDDDIYIIVCDLLDPFINYRIKAVLGDYPHIILKDWRC